MTAPSAIITSKVAGCSMTYLTRTGEVSWHSDQHIDGNVVDPHQDAEAVPTYVVAFYYLSDRPIVLADGTRFDVPTEQGWYATPWFFIGTRVLILGKPAIDKMVLRRRELDRLLNMMEERDCHHLVELGRGEYFPFRAGIDIELTPRYVEPD